MLEVNNSPIPAPSEFRVGIQDISKAERNAQGDMLIDRVATKRKLELKYQYLTPSELSRLLQLINSTSFFVKYPDPQTGLLEIKNFYVGDRNLGMYAYMNGEPVWTDISFNFVEM